MPRQVLIVTAILCLLAGGLGLRLGVERISLTESDVIAAAAARWSAETGQTDFTSCVAWARPEGDVWLEVTCGMDDLKRRYVFDDWGNLVESMGPET